MEHKVAKTSKRARRELGPGEEVMARESEGGSDWIGYQMCGGNYHHLEGNIKY